VETGTRDPFVEFLEFGQTYSVFEEVARGSLYHQLLSFLKTP